MIDPAGPERHGAPSEGASIRNIVGDMCQEFLDETLETLLSLDSLLDSGRNGRSSGKEVIQAFGRAAIHIRAPAGNFGLRLLSTIANRLSDYLTNTPEHLPPRVWDDLQIFLDMMLAQAEGRKNDEDLIPAEVVRTLPRNLGLRTEDIQVRNQEVLLVMPGGAQTRFVEREMQQCGYHVSIVSDTLEAFTQAVQTKPDLIVISALMAHLDGIDLAIALASMPSTRNIPLAVITSLEPADDRLALLPKRVPLVYKGPSFGDDLFKALDSLFLI